MKYFRKLEGERVYISPMNPEDAETYTKWLNNPNINQYLSVHNSLISVSGEQDYINKFCKEEFHLAIIKKENDELIGNIGLEQLDYKNGTAELGIFIGDEDNLGKGYGSEAVKLITEFAFKELRLHSLYLRTYDFNKRAIKSYEKCGFKEFGRRHESEFIHGKYHDVVYMEIINKE